jgi:predicted ATP-grasp superfamily ATP-dependent carboligase
MSDAVPYLALFKEDAIDQAAEAVERLRGLGIGDRDISVISGVPYSDKILGRPMSWTHIGQIGIAGALVGFLTGAFLAFGTPYLYPLIVGGQPLYAIPTSIVVIFELTMLGLLISTFLGVFVETISPSYGPKGYSPKVTDGQIGVLFACPAGVEDQMQSTLKELDAEIICQTEEKQ